MKSAIPVLAVSVLLLTVSGFVLNVTAAPVHPANQSPIGAAPAIYGSTSLGFLNSTSGASPPVSITAGSAIYVFVGESGTTVMKALTDSAKFTLHKDFANPSHGSVYLSAFEIDNSGSAAAFSVNATFPSPANFVIDVIVVSGENLTSPTDAKTATYGNTGPTVSGLVTTHFVNDLLVAGFIQAGSSLLAVKAGSAGTALLKTELGTPALASSVVNSTAPTVGAYALGVTGQSGAGHASLSYVLAVRPAPAVVQIQNFPVSFTETGIPNGTEWAVDLNGMQRLNTTPVNTTVFWIPDGTYTYTAGAFNLETNDTSRTLGVNGASVYVNLTYYGQGFLQQFDSHISHIVFIYMENRAYDQFFAGYCLQLSPVCNSTANGLPTGTCVPQLNVTGGCVDTFNYTQLEIQEAQEGGYNPCHVYNCTVADIDGGKMNGFYTGEQHNGTQLGPNNYSTIFGHYNGSTIPVYWDMAQEYGLGDNSYSAELSYSLPNHWYLVAGQAPTPFQTQELDWNNHFEYLNAANQTETIQDLLNLTPSVSWKYYMVALPTTYQAAIASPSEAAWNAGTRGFAYNIWNPFAGRAESYQSWYSSHFVGNHQVLKDAASGNLPDISWVIPGGNDSDHPPDNVSTGEQWVSDVVNAITQGPDWNSTAIFLTWDDFGGFFDHQAPPRIDPFGFSFRTPLIAISPYTPAGTIDHQLLSQVSVLALMEARYHLGCITARDCLAQLPSGFFNFSIAARPGLFFGLNDVYPYQDPPREAGTLVWDEWVSTVEDDAD